MTHQEIINRLQAIPAEYAEKRAAIAARQTADLVSLNAQEEAEWLAMRGLCAKAGHLFTTGYGRGYIAEPDTKSRCLICGQPEADA